jgi:hypothetical protein
MPLLLSYLLGSRRRFSGLLLMVALQMASDNLQGPYRDALEDRLGATIPRIEAYLLVQATAERHEPEPSTAR